MEHTPKSPPVDTIIIRFAPQQLGRHVADRAEAERFLLGHDGGEAEVAEEPPPPMVLRTTTPVPVPQPAVQREALSETLQTMWTRVEEIVAMRPPEPPAESTLEAIEAHLDKQEERAAEGEAVSSWVVQQYIHNPLLIGGKKFDLRVYVVVTSYRPLRAFTSRLGFARFCSVSYSEAKADMDNPFVHLTNVAIQKRGDEYNESHGNKWPIHLLRLYLAGTRSEAVADELRHLITEEKQLAFGRLPQVFSASTHHRHCHLLCRRHLHITPQTPSAATRPRFVMGPSLARH